MSNGNGRNVDSEEFLQYIANLVAEKYPNLPPEDQQRISMDILDYQQGRLDVDMLSEQALQALSSIQATVGRGNLPPASAGRPPGFQAPTNFPMDFADVGKSREEDWRAIVGQEKVRFGPTDVMVERYPVLGVAPQEGVWQLEAPTIFTEAQEKNAAEMRLLSEYEGRIGVDDPDLKTLLKGFDSLWNRYKGSISVEETARRSDKEDEGYKGLNADNTPFTSAEFAHWFSIGAGKEHRKELDDTVVEWEMWEEWAVRETGGDLGLFNDVMGLRDPVLAQLGQIGLSFYEAIWSDNFDAILLDVTQTSTEGKGIRARRKANMDLLGMQFRQYMMEEFVGPQMEMLRDATMSSEREILERRIGGINDIITDTGPNSLLEEYINYAITDRRFITPETFGSGPNEFFADNPVYVDHLMYQRPASSLGPTAAISSVEFQETYSANVLGPLNAKLMQASFVGDIAEGVTTEERQRAFTIATENYDAAALAMNPLAEEFGSWKVANPDGSAEDFLNEPGVTEILRGETGFTTDIQALEPYWFMIQRRERDRVSAAIDVERTKKFNDEYEASYLTPIRKQLLQTSDLDERRRLESRLELLDKAQGSLLPQYLDDFAASPVEFRLTLEQFFSGDRDVVLSGGRAANPVPGLENTQILLMDIDEQEADEELRFRLDQAALVAHVEGMAQLDRVQLAKEQLRPAIGAFGFWDKDIPATALRELAGFPTGDPVNTALDVARNSVLFSRALGWDVMNPPEGGATAKHQDEFQALFDRLQEHLREPGIEVTQQALKRAQTFLSDEEEKRIAAEGELRGRAEELQFTTEKTTERLGMLKRGEIPSLFINDEEKERAEQALRDRMASSIPQPEPTRIGQRIGRGIRRFRR